LNIQIYLVLGFRFYSRKSNAIDRGQPHIISQKSE
jgi:hypothetical protein